MVDCSNDLRVHFMGGRGGWGSEVQSLTMGDGKNVDTYFLRLFLTFHSASPVASYWYQNIPATIPLQLTTAKNGEGAGVLVMQIWYESLSYKGDAHKKKTQLTNQNGNHCTHTPLPSPQGMILL